MGDQTATAPRSTGVTVLGGIMLAFGALGMLSVPLALAGRYLGTRSGSHLQELMWTGTLGAWTMSSIGLRALIRLLLAASGLGVLGRRRWAKTSTIIYAIAAITLSVVEQLVSILFLYPRLVRMLESGSPVDSGGAMGGLVGGIFGGLFGLVLPVAILIVITRPSVRAELVR